MRQDLGDRMKNNYELRHRHFLTRRTPVIVRVDGRAFHTLTKGFNKPFDLNFGSAMSDAAGHLFMEMQGCKMAYVQSDEASFVLTDYDRLATEGWFNYNQSKIESVSAAIMTTYFNHMMGRFGYPTCSAFDARAFNTPEDAVANYFLWRAQDWHRNSVTMYAQSSFSHKQLLGKDISAMHEMLHSVGKNWTTDLQPCVRNGVFMYRKNSASKIELEARIHPVYTTINPIWEYVRPEEDAE